MGKQKDNKRNHFPPNVSANYYTDPAFSSDAFYGFEHEGYDTDHDSEGNKNMQQSLGEEQTEPIDEPVESWGWINNVDNRHF